MTPSNHTCPRLPIPLTPPNSTAVTTANVAITAGCRQAAPTPLVLEDDNVRLRIPPGYRFRPYDEELILHYLNKKVLNQKLPPNNMKVVNIYRHSPQDLSEEYGSGEEVLYFFTPRERKYKNGGRPNRAARNGFWKASGADEPITVNGHRIGSKKRLVFYEGNNKVNRKTNWLMHEYTMKDAPPCNRLENEMKLDDWVLCKIYKIGISQNNRARRRAANEYPGTPATRDNVNEPIPMEGGNVDNGDLTYPLPVPNMPFEFQSQVPLDNVDWVNVRPDQTLAGSFYLNAIHENNGPNYAHLNDISLSHFAYPNVGADLGQTSPFPNDPSSIMPTVLPSSFVDPNMNTSPQNIPTAPVIPCLIEPYDLSAVPF